MENILDKILKNIEGAIFDLDGTLLDSMGMWENIDKEYLGNRNIPMPANLKMEIEHLSFRETAEYFKSRFNISDCIEIIEKDWYNMAFSKYAKNAMIKPYAKQFLRLLKSKNIKIALATSNYRTTSIAALKRNHIYELFDAIITTQDITRGKNFPDIYIVASTKINIPPEKCVVFEDSLPAIKAARQANMYVVAVHDKYCPYDWQYILKYSNAGIIDFSKIICE
ncbi:HAD family hydrolase [Clostridium sp. LBM24168]